MKLLGCFPITGLIMALTFNSNLLADTAGTRCDFYPAGSDRATKVTHCRFSQRRGTAHILVDDGTEYDFAPDAESPGVYFDEKGRKVVREQDGDVQIFHTRDETVFIFSDPAIGSERKNEPPAGFKKRLEMQGYTFHVEATAEGSLNTLTIVPIGVEQDDLIEKQIDGTVTDAEIADLDGNGFPELYVYITSAGSGSYGTLEAFVVNRGISLTPIFFPEMSESDRRGYMGHDVFSIQGDTLTRRFPVYRKGDSNANPSGGIRALRYRLEAGETGWKLRPERSQSVENTE